MKTYSRLTLVLTFLLLPIASGILFTAPTFGDSLSGSETFDAQQFLSEAKAQQVAEAGKQGALIGFIVSLVIAYVMSPIDQQRWFKVVIVILGVTGGYFGSTFSAENSGVSSKVAFELQSRMERAAVKLAMRELGNEVIRMDRVGIDTVGLNKVLKSVADITVEKETAVSTKDVDMFDNQLQRLVPALQKQLDAVIGSVDSLTEFSTAFGGAGMDLAFNIANLTGMSVQEIFDEINKKIKTAQLSKQINKDRRESMKRQAKVNDQLDTLNGLTGTRDAGQRLSTGRSITLDDGSTVAIGGLNEDQMKRFSDPNERDKLDKLRSNRKRMTQISTMDPNYTGMKKADRDAILATSKNEQDAFDQGRTDDAKAWRKEASKLMREELGKALGAENVTDTDVAKSLEMMYSGKDISKMMQSRVDSQVREYDELKTESDSLGLGLQTGAGALTNSQLYNLLQNPQLFNALAKDIELYMKSMPKEQTEPVEDTKQVTPDSAQKPTAAETMQSSKPQKRSNRRRRMKTR